MHYVLTENMKNVAPPRKLNASPTVKHCNDEMHANRAMQAFIKM